MSKRDGLAAAYADWKLIKTRGVVQIILEIPVEKANDAYQLLGGMPNSASETWVAIARLKQQQEETTTATDKPAPTQPPARVHKLAMRAGILSNDSLFHTFLATTKGLGVNSEGAADYVRHFCQVESRKEILPGTEAANRFDLLESAFICWRDKDKFVEQPA